MEKLRQIRKSYHHPLQSILSRLSLGRWGWLSPGGFLGLQNRWRVAERAAVGSTPIHPRLNNFPILFISMNKKFDTSKITDIVKRYFWHARPDSAGEKVHRKS